MDTEPISFRYAGAAKATGLSERAIRLAVARGELRALHVGRARVILRHDLLEWLERTEPAGQAS